MIITPFIICYNFHVWYIIRERVCAWGGVCVFNIDLTSLTKSGVKEKIEIKKEVEKGLKLDKMTKGDFLRRTTFFILFTHLYEG